MAMLVSILLTTSAMQAVTAMPALRAAPHGPLGSLGLEAEPQIVALRERASAATGFVIGIGEHGRVTSCRVTASSGVSGLDVATCRVMRARARFAWARDASGAPAADAMTGRIEWGLAGARPRILVESAAAEMLPPAVSRGPAVIPARARVDLARYVARPDYPRTAFLAGEEGKVEFRLRVAPDGRVSDCVVIESSGSAALDAAACRLMRSRARFTPALDAAGQPTADTIEAQLDWQLPRVEPAT